MNEQEALRLAVELMESAEAAFLTTIDGDGFPQSRAMLNLRNARKFPELIGLFSGHRDDFTVYFTTNTSSPKVVQIRAKPAVSVYYCSPAEWRGLMLGGMMEIVADPGLKKALWQEGWEMYYPDGATDPDYTILRLAPAVAKYYHQMSNCTFGLESDR
ncbi:MAG: pyridoxamine 5'-phosphate oxidase-like FMN-binding [Geobacteraceae bacterium]|nr:MAG: pyridoxamine 5'-phosphate oxidase-like FMN-binding [Geobacteraceae bacterium]